MLVIREKKLNTVEGFEKLSDIYYIADSGELLSYRNGKRRVLKPMVSSKGYLKYWRNGKSFSIHQAVAKAFIPNPDKKEQVNHIDGNKANNDVSNLEWVNNLENMRHSWEIGLRKPKKGAENYQWEGSHSNCKGVRQISLEGTIIGEYASIAIASRESGFKRAGISKACNGVINTYMGCKWEFLK